MPVPAMQVPPTPGAYGGSQMQVAVPEASEQVPCPLQVSPALAHVGRHVPFRSLSWKPAAHWSQDGPGGPLGQVQVAELGSQLPTEPQALVPQSTVFDDVPQVFIPVIRPQTFPWLAIRAQNASSASKGHSHVLVPLQSVPFAQALVPQSISGVPQASFAIVPQTFPCNAIRLQKSATDSGTHTHVCVPTWHTGAAAPQSPSLAHSPIWQVLVSGSQYCPTSQSLFAIHPTQVPSSEQTPTPLLQGVPGLSLSQEGSPN